MRCIFCLQESAETQEHVFPEAIGGSLIIERVCKRCNSILGAKVDAPLSDHPLIALARWRLGVRGKSGRIPDPFRDVLGVGRLASDPDKRVIVTAPSVPGEQVDIRGLHHREEIMQPDGRKYIRVSIDRRDSEQIGLIIQRERRRAGLPPLGPADLELEISNATAGVRTIEHPCVTHSLQIDLTSYRRGILKIAYELGWRWLGEDYLSDPDAISLRDAALRYDELADPENGIVSNFAIGPSIGPFAMWASEPNNHMALAQSSAKGIAIFVRIFREFSAVIFLTRNPARYQHFSLEHMRGMFLSMNPVDGTRRELLLSDEINRLLGN
jgi:hypothetical protein